MLEIEPRAYHHPDVVALIHELQADYVRIYGTPDETPIDDDEFDPPRGLFLVGLLDGDPVAIGGWRRIEGDGEVSTAEIKRMYVAERARGRGLSRRLLAHLEQTLADAGVGRVVLMTGRPQLAAIALYESSGYLPARSYGRYACAPDARFFEKTLVARAADRAAGRAGLATRG